MPITPGRRDRADLDDLLSNVSAAPARCKQPLVGDDGLWRLVTKQAGEGATSLGSEAPAAHSGPGVMSKARWQAIPKRGDDTWAVGAALEALANVDAEPSAKPANVSLRCATPQLTELIEPVERLPAAASSNGTPLQAAAEASGAAHGVGLAPSAGGTGGAQTRTAKPPISSAGCREIDPVLARVIEAWPKLPRPIQAAIRTLAETGRAES